MSGEPSAEAAALPAREDARWTRLPAWLRPRSGEPARGGDLWLVETTLLVLVGLVLAVASINDVARQTGINQRLIADLKTWRHATGHDFHGISIDQQTLGEDSDREVLCGNTSAGPPDARAQLCLAIWGPVRDGRRTVHGGWYLPAYVQDLPSERYGCFGVAGRGHCTR
jgi:hypothetical protein